MKLKIMEVQPTKGSTYQITDSYGEHWFVPCDQWDEGDEYPDALFFCDNGKKINGYVVDHAEIWFGSDIPFHETNRIDWADAAELEANAIESEFSQRKWKRSSRRKNAFKAENRRYECKIAKRNRIYGRKGMRDFDSQGTRYCKAYEYEQDGGIFLSWVPDDSMKKWRNRKESEVISYEAD